MDIETAYKFYSDSSKLPYNVGRITCVQRDRCSLESIDGTVYASCSKKAMRDTAPAIGDWCIFEKNGGALIYEILPRKSTLSRKVSGNQMREQIIAANIDLVCVCLSIREGIRLSVVNRLLFGFSGNFRQMLLLTQSDLCEDPTNEVALIKRDLPGVVIQDVCAIRDDLSSVLGPFLRSGETMALVGPSGVGKSTIINSLLWLQ